MKMVVITPKMELDRAWSTFYSMDGPQGKKGALDYMWKAVSGLSPSDRQRVQSYLTEVMCDRSNGSVPRLTYNGLCLAPIITDLAARLSAEQGNVPDEFYRALGILPACDERTRKVLGETLQLKPEKKDERLARIRDIAAAEKDDKRTAVENAFRIMRRTHGVLVPYAGMREDDDEEGRRRFLANIDPHYVGRESMAEILDAIPEDAYYDDPGED